ncbi:hypothetical protein [Glycomyces dulcitolivorans]|uniref:hypothetical protein n=1 Tax=Glycomyces dulcitolivorans TaxID=2200759 RepID=UPI000DD361D8|nr:hypothetical protein [Glycomyces dulcitolivorans]
MSGSARANFDTVFGLAGEPARRAREFAGKVREDLRSGSESARSGAERLREHGGRTVHDVRRLIRAEFDNGLTRMGVATQADLDDLNLRLEHSEEQIRELRVRLAEAEAAATAAKLAEASDAAAKRAEPAPAEAPAPETPAAAPPTSDDDEGHA